MYNFKVADTHTYVVGKSKAWVHNADCDLVGGLVNTTSARGHHIFSKAAFKNKDGKYIKGYDVKKAFTIPNDELNNLGIRHLGSKINGDTVSAAQKRLYSAYAKKGKPLTLEKMAQIEYKAMRLGGASKEYTRAFIGVAYKQLRDLGLRPGRIPGTRY